MIFSLNPNLTLSYKREQKTLPPRRSSQTHDYNNEYHNLASDYMYGKTNRHAETPELTFDQYINLVRAFASMAQSFVTREPDADTLIDSAVAGEITQIPASPEDFVRSYKDAYRRAK